ncbi:transposase [Ferroplasma sp.]
MHNTFNVNILHTECDNDYFHMLFKSTSKFNIPKFINRRKTMTLREK